MEDEKGRMDVELVRALFVSESLSTRYAIIPIKTVWSKSISQSLILGLA
jgi:hypothetical protein